MTKTLYDEIIDEIGTRTKERFGVDIFSLDTYKQAFKLHIQEGGGVKNIQSVLVNKSTNHQTNVIAQSVDTNADACDAVLVALKTLANNAMFEIKDAFNENSNTSLEIRAQRLMNATTKSLQEIKALMQDNELGYADISVVFLRQVFEPIIAKMNAIWKNFPEQMKQISNAVCDYMSGKISSFKELLSTIVKIFFTAVIAIISVGLESKLAVALAPMMTPLVASFVAPALAIIVGSIAVVTMSKTVDFALETLFGVFAQAEISKKRYEEIAALCMEKLPQIIENRQMLATKMKQAHYERKLKFDTSFEGYKQAILNKDDKQSFEYLSEICKLYGAKLEYRSAKEILTNNTGKLQW